jgi:tape measure domain-containing protein
MGVKAGSAGRLSIELIAEIARLQHDLDKAKRAVGAASRDISRSARAANDNMSAMGTGFDRAAQRAAHFSRTTVSARKSVSGFVSGVRGMAASLGLIGASVAGRQLLSLADEYKQLTAQLKLATAQSGSFTVAQRDVRQIAADTRSGLDETAKLYATFARTSHELGLSQAQVARITQTVNQSFKISGASLSEASGATRQLVQAFQSGVLRGEEFNSIMENAPRLARLLADSMNVPISSLRGMAEEGDITAAKLAKAFSDRKFTDALDQEFRDLPVTFDEAMGQIHNAAVVTFGAFDRGGQFSTAIANFILDGTNGFRDLEVAAESFGRNASSEIAALIAVLDSAATSVSNLLSSFANMPKWSPFGGLGWLAQNATGRAGRIGLNMINPLGTIGQLIMNSPTANNARDQQHGQLAMAGIWAKELLPEWGGLYPSRGNSTGASIAATAKDKGGSKRAAGLSEEARALKRRNEETERFIKNLQEEIAKTGLDEKAIRQLQVSREKEAATTEAQKTKIQQLSDAREAAIKLAEQQKAVDDANKLLDDYRKGTLADLDIELQTMEMVGTARDQEILRLRHQAEMTALAVDIRKAEIDENQKLVETLQEMGRAYEEAYSKGQQANAIKQRIEDTEKLNNELRDMIMLLQQIGGLGGTIGKALGVLQGFQTGDFSGVGGKFGATLQILNKVDGGEFLKGMGKELDGFLAKFGTSLEGLGQAFQALGAGAAIGDTTDGLMKALGIKSSNTGAQIGGAAGMAAFGPIGAIAGSIAGGIIGGFFKKTKWGRADISGVSSDPSIRGNKGKYETAAGDAAGSIIESLMRIADELGGVAGEFSKISIGVRDGKWRVNTTGTSLKTSAGAIDFGKDGADDAIAYAISEAIKAGAITGLRAGTLTLLKAGKDFNAQLEKARTFENVFKELQAELDPLGYELDQIGKKFASLRTIFAEANATAEEMAQLEQLQALQEAKARESAAAEAAAKKSAQLEKDAELLALQGKATASLAKSREAELLQLDKTLVAIQKQIYAEQDAATRRGLQVQLLEAQGNLLAAQGLSRAEVLRVTLDENKAIQQKIWLTEDLFAAYNRESEALQNTADKMRGFSATLREFRDSIYTSDQSGSRYTQALARLIQTGSLAATGDEAALGNLSGVGKEYLDVALASARSMRDYQRAQALVANYTDRAIGFTDSAATVAEQQLAEMKTTVGALITLNDSVISVEQAIERLTQHSTASTAASQPAPAANASNENLRKSFDRLSERFEEMMGGIRSIAQHSASTANVLRKVTRDGSALATVADDA